MTVQMLIDKIIEENPLQARFLASSVDSATDPELSELATYVGYAVSKGLTIEYLAACYDLIVKDTLREQLFFKKHRRYRYSSFDEVANSVYFNEDYMRKYMHGLALTAFLWPNHRQLHRFFSDTVPKTGTGQYLEIGPGHGMFMMTAMRSTEYSLFHGIDLSPTSVAMTNDLLTSGVFGTFSNYRIEEQDFIAGNIANDSYSAVVMGEVLEHVEHPHRFLERIRDVATNDAYIFITTPINAPAIDHIYLFRSFEDIEQLVLNAGLKVKDRLLAPYPGQPLEESITQGLPVNVAMVLKK